MGASRIGRRVIELLRPFSFQVLVSDPYLGEDHTEPEFLPAGSRLYDLPNVLVTPHIAGPLGGELARMADLALDELTRYARGLPFAHAVEPATLSRSA